MSTTPLIAPPSTPSGERIVIQPGARWRAVSISELWRFRELLYTLGARDIRIRYKQTALGIAWAVVQPVAQMVVFTVLFASHGFSTGGAPAPIFYFAGLLPWQLFANGLANSSNSLVANRGLITKVYFPRLVAPIAALAGAIVDFVVSLGVLLVLMLWEGIRPQPTLALLPLFFAATVFAAMSVSLWLSALNVEYRDVQYVIPFLVQIWFFVTPVIYPSASVTGRKGLLLSLNPMSAIIEGFRWCVVGGPIPKTLFGPSWMMILVLLIGGLFYFRRLETTFADQL